MANTTIRLDIEVDASKGTAAIKQFAGEAEAATKKAGDAAKEGGKGFGQFASSLDETAAKLKGLLTVENLVGAGIGVALVESLHSAMSAAEAYGDEIRRMSLITGAATEELSALVAANVEMGGSTERLQRALFLMSTQIEAGGPKLKQMGIDIRDSSGYLKNETSLLYEVSDAFHNMTDKSLAAAEARKIFGRGAADLIPLLMAGSERLKEMGIDAQTFGVSLSAGAVQALHEAEIETGKYGLAMLGLKNTLTQDFLPAHSLLMQGLTAVTVWFRTLPNDVRVAGEVIVTLTASVVALGVAFATLKTVASVINLASIFTTALGSVAGITAALLSWPALLAGLALALVIGLLFDVGGIRTTLADLASTLTTALTNTIRAIVGLPPIQLTFSFAAFDSWLSHAILNLKERLSGAPLTPALNEVAPRTPKLDMPLIGLDHNLGIGALEGAQLRDTKQLIAEKQEEMRLNALLGASEVELAKATLPTLEAQLVALKKNNQARLDAIDIEKLKDTRPEMTAKLDDVRVQQEEAYAASVEKIHADMAARDEARDKKAALEHAKALFAGEDLLKATMDIELADAQKKLDRDRSYLKDDSEAVKEFNAKKQAAYDQYAAGMKAVDVRRATEVAALNKQEYEIVLSTQKQIHALNLAGVEADKHALDLKLKNFQVSESEYVTQAQALEGQKLAIKFAFLQQESEAATKKADADRAALDTEVLSAKDYALKLEKIDLEEQKTQADINLKRVEATDATLKDMLALEEQREALSNQITREATHAELAIRLKALGQQAVDYANNAAALQVIDSQRLDAIQKDRDAEIAAYAKAELLKTGLLQDELTRRIAKEAKAIADIQAARQKVIDDSAIVLENQARREGDLWTAFESGFAHAASSAQDAFKAMGGAGAKVFNDLKSGLSDFLFDVFTGAKTIGDVFVNLGKRILRTFTDVFAEIIAKQTLMAAGFSLPGLLGTAGTAIAATAGFEGAPNQAATAVQQLGNTANGASDALSGMTGVTGAAIQMFAFLTTGVSKFIGFLSSILQTAGVPGNIASGLGGLVAGGGLSFGLGSLIFGGGGGGLGSGLGGLLGTGLGTLIPGLGTELLGRLLGPQLFTSLFSTLWPAIFGAVSNIVLPGIGFVIGGLIGNIFGGLFSGPTPEISGKVQLNSTNIQALLAATRAVPWSSGPGPNQVINPPGRSHFSSLDTGPLHSELYKHRTEGTLSREESQLDIQNVILATLQAAVKGLSQLGSRLPTEALSKALSTRIDAVLAKGFDVASFDFEGNVEDVVKNFQDFLKGLSSQTVTALTKDIFPSIDLAALGAGDAAKGFDVLASALGGFSALLVRSGHATDFAGDSIEQFATRSIDFFTQFTKDGETLAQTITRVSQQIGQMIDQLNAFHISTDQFLLGLQTQIGVLSVQSGGGLGEFNLLRDVAPGIIGAFSRDVQLQFLSPLIASLKEHALAAIEANAPIGDLLAGRQQVVGFGAGLFQSLHGEADPIKAIQGLQVLAKGAEDLLAGEIEGAKAYYAKQIALAQTAANARIAQLEEEKKTIQLNTSAIEAQITAAETHLRQLEEEKRGIEGSTKGLEDQIKALEAIGQARLAPLQEEQKLLQAQLSTLQQQAQAMQAWKGVLDSVTKQVTDMRLTTANPHNALERLTLAQQLVTQAKAQFAEQGTPESATALQQALGNELKIAQEAYQRPSSAYQHIFDQVSADLQAIQAVADVHAGDLAQLTREIADRQARIEALNQQIKEIEQQTQTAVKPLQTQLDALKAVNAARLQEIATEEAQIKASVQPLREQLQTMKADAATRLHAIEAEEGQVRATLQTTIAGLMSQQDSTIQGFREEATGWLRAIRNEAMVRLEQAVREGNAEIARLLGVSPPIDPRFTQASQGLMSLAQLAQGGGLPDIATSLASSARSIGQGQLPDTLTTMLRALAQAQGNPALQAGTGPEIISRFSSIIRDTQAGLYDPALASLNSLVQWLRSTGVVGAPVPGFASGLEYVPSDNFPARLHRGERVLTAEENRAYSNSRGGDVTIHFAPTVQVEMTGSESSDVIRRKIDEATATLLVTPSRTRAALVRFAREHRG